MSRWALGVLAAAAALTAIGVSSAEASPDLSYGCSPPAPATAQSCTQWHNGPVTLIWQWEQLSATPVAGNCNPQQFTQDAVSLAAACEVGDGSGTTKKTAFLHIDRTPPAVTGAAPARPPDRNGWWTHPVGFGFSGTDATSGVASCDTVTYAGPGGPGAKVVGGCHDVAGNYGVAGFPLSFDSTPPALIRLRATPRSRSAALSWEASPDTVRTKVVRAPGGRGRRQITVYSGKAHRFTDSGIANGTKYTYTVTVFDAAGNAGSRRVRARPELSLGLKPRRGARLRRPPLLRWPGVKGASYYNLQLYRGGVKVLTAWPGRAHLKLHRHGRFQGRRYRLGRGHYRWYVWPGYGSRAERRYGAFIGQGSFVLVR